VLVLWIPYLVVNTRFPGPVLAYALGMGLAMCSLSILWLSGISPQACAIRVAPLSRYGVGVLAVLMLFIPMALLAGRGQQLRWLDDVVYAPASAIAQEAYFRCALLTALKRLTGGRVQRALVLQALLFALWHARAFRVVAIAPALGVLVLTFAAGLLWGLQVARDKSVLYAALQHTLFLIVQ
jgi:membrane protease YdiL (CAAX protease family)